MTDDEARKTLCEGAPWARMGFAAVILSMSKPITARDNWLIWLALSEPGVVGEQAMFALYKRTGRQMPPNGNELVADPYQWGRWLLEAGEFEDIPMAAFDRANAMDINSLKAMVRGAIKKQFATEAAMQCQASWGDTHPIDAAS